MLTLRSVIDRGFGIVGVCEKNQKLIVGGWKKIKVLIAGGSKGGWLLNCFFLSFSNHENYNIL